MPDDSTSTTKTTEPTRSSVEFIFVWGGILLMWVLMVGGLEQAAGQTQNGQVTVEEPCSPLSVSIDFAGGSGTILEIDQAKRAVRLVPTPHKDRGWDCWWYVRVDGIRSGETITLDVGPGPWATPGCAAFSTDGRHWQRTPVGTRHTKNKRITYRQRIDSESAFFAWGPPYTHEDAERFCQQAVAGCPDAVTFVLCRTRGGRDVPALRVGQHKGGGAPPRAVWVQARQHAWEAGSSWVCQGFIEWLTSDDERARILREKSQVTVIPVMDVDNVAIGAGGKGQRPQDHNRDWSDQPQWHSVAAAQQRIREMDESGRFDVFIDLHNPDGLQKFPYFYLPQQSVLSERAVANQDRFLRTVQAEMTGKLAFRGLAKESGPNYDRARWKEISNNWIVLNCRPHVVALTLETPWNTPHSHTDGYRTVGRQLGLAIERYLRESPQEY